MTREAALGLERAGGSHPGSLSSLAHVTGRPTGAILWGQFVQQGSQEIGRCPSKRQAVLEASSTLAAWQGWGPDGRGQEAVGPRRAPGPGLEPRPPDWKPCHLRPLWGRHGTNPRLRGNHVSFQGSWAPEDPKARWAFPAGTDTQGPLACRGLSGPRGTGAFLERFWEPSPGPGEMLDSRDTPG